MTWKVLASGENQPASQQDITLLGLSVRVHSGGVFSLAQAGAKNINKP